MKTFAEKELEILSRIATDTNNRPVIEEFAPEIIALAKKFDDSGQTGATAPLVAGALSEAIKKLCLLKPISPITGEDHEWCEVMGETNQNNRCSAVFYDNDIETAYYLNAIIFKGQSGSCFTSPSVDLADGSKIGSRQLIKEFPFTPKTFYIDVIETEWSSKEETEKQEGGGWWTSLVKDESQLEEVFKYYDRFYSNK